MTAVEELEQKTEPMRRRFFLRSSVVEAERLEGGGWRVYGHGWLKDGVEFTDENFKANFTDEL